MPMLYQVLHLAQSESSILKNETGKTVTVPQVEIQAHASVKLTDLKEHPERITEAVATAQHEFAQTLHDLVAKQESNTHCILVVRTAPACLPVESPPRAMYDMPLGWDDELQEVIVPEGAKIIGHTEPELGWVIFAILGVLIANEPLDDAPTRNHIPLWANPVPPRPPDLSTAQGRAHYAQLISNTMGLGEPPWAHNRWPDLASKEPRATQSIGGPN